METITVQKIKGESKSELRKRVMLVEKQNPGCNILIAPVKAWSEAKIKFIERENAKYNDDVPLTKSQIEQMENYHRNINRNLMER